MTSASGDLAPRTSGGYHGPPTVLRKREAGRNDLMVTPEIDSPKMQKLIESSGVHCITSIMVDPPPRQVHDERFPADKPQNF